MCCQLSISIPHAHVSAMCSMNVLVYRFVPAASQVSCNRIINFLLKWWFCFHVLKTKKKLNTYINCYNVLWLWNLMLNPTRAKFFEPLCSCTVTEWTSLSWGNAEIINSYPKVEISCNVEWRALNFVVGYGVILAST